MVYVYVYYYVAGVAAEWGAAEEDPQDAALWEEGWDNEAEEDDFAVQLRLVARRRAAARLTAGGRGVGLRGLCGRAELEKKAASS